MEISGWAFPFPLSRHRRIHWFMLSALLLPAEAVPERLDPLVVSGRRWSKEESDKPIETLATLGTVDNLGAMLRFEPNVGTGGSLGSSFSVRGLTQEGSPSFGARTNPALGVAIGAFPRSTNNLWIMGAAAWDSRLAEVTRGPVLFGNGAVSQGGEVRLDPNEPVFEDLGRLTLEVGRHGTYRGGLTSNTVLVPEQLALRAGVCAEGHAGWIDNAALGQKGYNHNEQSFGRGELRWHPAGNPLSTLDFTLEAEKVRGNSLGFANSPPGGTLFDRWTSRDTEEKVPAERIGVSVEFESALDNRRTLEGELTWQSVNGYQLADYDGGSVLSWYYRYHGDEQRLTGGARLKSVHEHAVWKLGMYGESSVYAYDFTGIGFTPVPEGSPFSSVLDEDVRMAAAFAHGELEIHPRWWLAGGLRVDHQHRSLASSASIPAKTPVTDEAHVDSTAALPELGLEWRDGPLTAGLKLSRAYRPGGVAYAGSLGQTATYGEEIGWEASTFAERDWENFHATGRLFLAKLDDQQMRYVLPGGFPTLDSFVLNGGKSTRGGVELEWRWKGPGDLNAGLSGGWLHTHYDSLVLFGMDRSGQAFPLSPEWTAAAFVAWTPLQGWFADAGLSWQDSTYSVASSPVATALESRLELAARAGYRWKKAEIYLFGTNLLDDDYALVRQDFSSYGRGIEGRPNMPRMIGAGITLDW